MTDDNLRAAAEAALDATLSCGPASDREERLMMDALRTFVARNDALLADLREFQVDCAERHADVSIESRGFREAMRRMAIEVEAIIAKHMEGE